MSTLKSETNYIVPFIFFLSGGDMLEREYQSQLIKRISHLIPGCEIIKLDPNQVQGIPDLLVLAPTGRWATLEVKRSEKSKKRPNQEFYVEQWGQKAFSSFIYPENEEEVLRELCVQLSSQC